MEVQFPITPYCTVSLRACFMFVLRVIPWFQSGTFQQSYNSWLVRSFSKPHKLSLLELSEHSAFFAHSCLWEMLLRDACPFHPPSTYKIFKRRSYASSLCGLSVEESVFGVYFRVCFLFQIFSGNRQQGQRCMVPGTLP